MQFWLRNKTSERAEHAILSGGGSRSRGAGLYPLAARGGEGEEDALHQGWRVPAVAVGDRYRGARTQAPSHAAALGKARACAALHLAEEDVSFCTPELQGVPKRSGTPRLLRDSARSRGKAEGVSRSAGKRKTTEPMESGGDAEESSSSDSEGYYSENSPRLQPDPFSIAEVFDSIPSHHSVNF